MNPEDYYGWNREPDGEHPGFPPPEPILQTYGEHMENVNAVAEGRATALLACYLCQEDVTERLAHPERAPLRGILRVGQVQALFDRTETYTLTCGHTVV